MTTKEELNFLLEIMRKYDLPLSPILEFAIRNKMEDSGEDSMVTESCLIDSGINSPQSLEISPIDRSFQHSYVDEPGHKTRISETNRKNRKKTILRVTRPDGTTIEYRKATETLVETIQEIGVERVRNLNLSLDGMNLILIGKDSSYLTQQYYLGDGYYLNTHSSTERKKYHLEKIFSALELKWKVEIVSSEG